jgi:hypothetical protein
MKTVKKLVTIVSLFIALGFAANAQTSATETKESLFKKLTTSHNSASEHAKKISSGTAKTTAEQKTATEAAGKHLESAKATHQKLKTTIPGDKREAARIHHDAIDKHHSAAALRHKDLTMELSKTVPDETKVKLHATEFDKEMANAEKEHQSLQKAVK